ncbi:MAG: glycosyltransferase family 2 protein [Patescibacteria group bacterium]|nr:glycosyltransferase family 2 protein [Patescibacteria group bacterium]
MAFGQIGIYFFLFLGLYFEVFLLITFFEKRPTVKTVARPLRYPSVSIIVPCWNEERTLAGTLKSLLSLEYPKDKLSIIVVNDGSTDSTLAIAEQFASNPQVHVLSKKNGGKYTALNTGIEHSKSELVGCLDADSFVVPDALIESVKKFEENPKTMAVVPAMKVNRPRNLLELMQAVEYTFGIFYRKMFDNISAISVLPGPFSIYRREMFSITGPFRHAHNTEDMEMAFRMHAYGLRIENAHTSVVYTNVPRTVRSLVRQRTRWSQGFLQNSRDYRYMYFNRRYGHFGTLVLPFLLVMFLGGLYGAAFVLYRIVSWIVAEAQVFMVEKIPMQVPHFSLDWFYFNTSTMTLLVIATVCTTLAAVLIGRRIAGANFGIWSIVSYFTIYGLVAPLWLANAAWGAVRSRESRWR